MVQPWHCPDNHTSSNSIQENEGSKGRMAKGGRRKEGLRLNGEKVREGDKEGRDHKTFFFLFFFREQGASERLTSRRGEG